MSTESRIEPPSSEGISEAAARNTIALNPDHITPWKGVHKTARIMGDDTTFVLSNSGHLQSLLNPPTNPKASFVIGRVDPAGPDAFLASAEKRKGSWWLDLRDWLRARSGEEIDAPASLGSKQHPFVTAAPGTYVFE